METIWKGTAYELEQFPDGPFAVAGDTWSAFTESGERLADSET